MEPITKEQIKLIKTVASKQKIDSADLAYSYSSSRTEHVSQLYKEEALELIKWLLKQSKQAVTPADKMRNKILSMAHEMGWELPYRRNGKSNVIDMNRVDNWCLRYGYIQQPLDLYTEAELPRLVSQFEQVFKSYLKAI